MEIPLDLINHVQISLRRHANLPSFDPDGAPQAGLPSAEEAVAALDPSPPYLRCRHCRGRLLRGLQSPICVFCGRDACNGIVPEPINFRNSIGYRWFLESLCLDGSEIVTPSVEANTTHRGRTAPKDELPLSDLLDLEIKWPSELEKIGSRLANEKQVQSKSSVNLSGVNIENFFSNEEKGAASNASKEPSAPANQIFPDDSVEVHNNLDLFENAQPSQPAAPSADNDRNFSDSGWGADFQSAHSGTTNVESTSFHPFVGLENLSAQMDEVFQPARDSSMDMKGGATTGSASMASDLFADDQWKNSNMEGPSEEIKTGAKVNSVSTVDNVKFTGVDWAQDDRWQSESKKESDGNADEGDDSFDDWNDFASSTTAQDPSSTWKQTTMPVGVKTPEMNFDVNFFNSFSQPNLVPGEFSTPNVSGEGNKTSSGASVINRTADANTVVREDSDDEHTHREVSTAETASKGIVAPSVEANSTHGGLTAPKDELQLSDPLDLEIKWPSELEQFGSHLVNEKPVQSKSSENLSGVNIENFFANEEKGGASNASAEPSAPVNQIYTKDDTEDHNNLNLFENAQPSQPAAASTDDDSDYSDSGWGTDFQSAPSRTTNMESTSFDPFVGSINLSAHLDEVFGPAKDSSIDAKAGPTTGFASMASDWYADDPWNNSNLGGSSPEIKTDTNVNAISVVENMKHSLSTDVDWVLDGRWQSDSKKQPNGNADDGDDSSDGWNDFSSSTTAQDPSSTLKSTTMPADEKASEMNFFSSVNHSQDVNFFDSFSQPDLFSGEFSSPNVSGGNKMSSEASIIDRTADANTNVRGDSDDVQKHGDVLTAETTSKAGDVEMILGVVAPSVEAENNTHRGPTATKDERWLSDPLDLGIKWPSELEKFGSCLSNEKPVQSKDSVNLSGVNIENFFANEEKVWASNASAEPSAPVNQIFTKDSIEVYNNLKLFENAQPSQPAAPSADYDTDLSDSGWATDFQSAPFGTTNVESTSVDPFMGSINLSARLDELYGPAKGSSIDTESGVTTGPASVGSNWFADDLWNNSNSGLSGPSQEIKASANVNSSSALEDVKSSLSTGGAWVQDDRWQRQSDSKNESNGNAEDGGDDSSDDWNDFASSTTAQDFSSTWKKSTLPADEKTSETNFFSSTNQS